MTKIQIEDVITELAKPIAERNDVELFDVEFVKEGPDWYLRVYISSPDGIKIEDCEIVSKELSKEIDRFDNNKKEFIQHSYFLEILSSGLYRVLKKDLDFLRFKGEQVELEVFKPVNNKKRFEGTLIGSKSNGNDKIIVIQLEDAEILEFDKKSVSVVRRTL